MHGVRNGGFQLDRSLCLLRYLFSGLIGELFGL
jgi:hypothetical protein